MFQNNCNALLIKKHTHVFKHIQVLENLPLFNLDFRKKACAKFYWIIFKQYLCFSISCFTSLFCKSDVKEILFWWFFWLNFSIHPCSYIFFINDFLVFTIVAILRGHFHKISNIAISMYTNLSFFCLSTSFLYLLERFLQKSLLSKKFIFVKIILQLSLHCISYLLFNNNNF